MKKIFGALVASENPEGIFYIQESLCKKISKKFDDKIKKIPEKKSVRIKKSINKIVGKAND